MTRPSQGATDNDLSDFRAACEAVMGSREFDRDAEGATVTIYLTHTCDRGVYSEMRGFPAAG